MADQDKQEPQENTEAQAEEYRAQQGAEETTEGQGEDTVEALQAKVEALTGAMEAAKDQVLRSQAEAQNARRRAEQDVEKAHKFGQEKLLTDLLPVVDNLERGLAAIDPNEEALKPVAEGIQLTLKAFTDVLAKYQVVPLDPQGEPFDPQFHQAMTMVPNPDVEPNTVVEVFQKGYTLHGRLVRPAMVVVSKAP
ncbi:nucleotide exchange factor GrpE [Marinimicrobium sp. ABcell2]|uniref:nucleotide exchange factor GrpE n=1 Tax=Marinimicrobium sp. ABcell2 TaxID=3069751 RepID=UPI0027ADCDD5|nr:nucleotide exchange factor GrpE [Marinimicrobium sp. ABcell2]MDQ2076354.1 nucleotide exchange factor GrpE [Marinimicrobium sp. ABcell2]